MVDLEELERLAHRFIDQGNPTVRVDVAHEVWRSFNALIAEVRRLRAEVERRPDISAEDAAAWERGRENAATMWDEDGQKRVIKALRAHAQKAVKP